MKIIAVDDDRVALDLLEVCLTDGGYDELTFMTSPLEALQEIEDAAVVYDCILLDVEMPERDGIVLCADIRKQERYRNTPILMITKHKRPAEVERAFASGATDYITKPFEFFEVLTRIRIAERLVRKRQAALANYMAVQARSNRVQKKARTSVVAKKVAASVARKPMLALVDKQLQVTEEILLPVSVFQNYLERITRDDECEINLVAMKVTNIDKIFAQTSMEEFVDFLKAAADAMQDELKSEKAFMAHAGNGVFLCATRGLNDFDAASTEARILDSLELYKLPQVWRMEAWPEIIVGAPLRLPPTSKLNFPRAVKAAMTRMEKREMLQIRSDPALLARAF